MSGEKRPAPEAFGHTSQLVVKRKKSDADLNPGTAVMKSSSQNGALIQAVCGSPRRMFYAYLSLEE
jgi:Prp8 binding protein